MSKRRIAIIGAGMSGLTLAHHLPHDEITLFDKGYYPGGRLCSRFIEGRSFDHGVQFFSPKSEAFQQATQQWAQAGVIAPWLGTFAELTMDGVHHTQKWTDTKPHYVGVPNMRALACYLANDLNVLTQTKIERIERHENAWWLHSESMQYGPFDWVITTPPPPQSLSLLPPTFAEIAYLQQIRMQGCFALMLCLDAPIKTHGDMMLIKEGPLSWIAANHSKPERPQAPAYLLHARNRWADSHMIDTDEMILASMMQAFFTITGVCKSAISSQQLHRWKYANLAKQPSQMILIDPAQKLAACGDWAHHGRVESAYLNARSLAEKLQTLV